jgi:5-methyltetrahydrofolate--homocysteine methyltransferase
MNDVLQELYQAVIEGKHLLAQELTEGALGEGVKPSSILNEALVPAMDKVGQKMATQEFFIPEVLVAANAMSCSMDVLGPLLTEAGIKPKGRIVIGTVKGDLHDIGKNLVSMMLEGAGWEVIDLGVDISPERFVEAIKEKSPDLLGLSALLTTTMPMMETTIEMLVEAGVRDDIKVLIGGAPITERFAQQIGADGYGRDAGHAVVVANELGMNR